MPSGGRAINPFHGDTCSGDRKPPVLLRPATHVPVAEPHGDNPAGHPGNGAVLLSLPSARPDISATSSGSVARPLCATLTHGNRAVSPVTRAGAAPVRCRIFQHHLELIASSRALNTVWSQRLSAPLTQCSPAPEPSLPPSPRRYLQWMTMGPASGGVDAFTLRMKASSPVAW